MRKLLFFVLSFYITESFSQTQISVEDFTTRNTFFQKTVTGINWMKNGKYYSTLDANKVLKFDITTGEPVETLVDGSTLPTAISIDDYSLSEDESKMLLQTQFENIYRRSYTAEYFIYDLKTKTLRQLSSKGKQSYATFSPQGDKVAFVRDNNLFYVDLASEKEIQVTNDGKFNHIINGSTDWVYEEEFVFTQAFFWSPDGNTLAYYRFDESAVKEYNLQRWKKGQLYPEDYRFKYPKAGEANSTIEIWFYDLVSGKKTKADTGNEKDIYIPRIKWTTNPNALAIMKLNRLQNQLEIILSEASTGKSNVILTEQSTTYIDNDLLDDITFLPDGKQFIYASERDGFKHLYLYSTSGTLIRQLTKGNFDVSQFIGIDNKAKLLYCLSTEVSPLEKHFYALTLDGKKKSKLSQQAGTHQINMSSDFQFYIDHHSSARHPVIASLFQTKGNKLVKVLEKNETLVSNAQNFNLATKEFYSFKLEDGTVINGLMLKPKDFDPSKKYPVIIYQYSGPGSQNVSDSWAGSHFYFHQLLTQKGYIVAIVDTRGTGGRGEKFKKVTYKQLGKFELEDIIASAKHLSSFSYIDSNRIGIWGWSYGGYMTSLAMTKGGGIFKVGIAVAPVTNWRFYDTIYTERYLQRPQLNAEGYDQNSPLFFADGLRGKFLLIHGTGDDNVHFQNSVAFQEALINAGKQFDSFYYPDKTHSIAGGTTKLHLYTMMLSFIQANL
jgi:dipeptidyl-peptidase 4